MKASKIISALLFVAVLVTTTMSVANVSGKITQYTQMHRDAFSQKIMANHVLISRAPALGNKNAPVTMLIFSDYECPFCQRAQDQVEKFTDEHIAQKDVRFIYAPFPLTDLHPDAMPAAQMELYIFEVYGADDFMKFNNAMFRNFDTQADYPVDNVVKKIFPAERADKIIAAVKRAKESERLQKQISEYQDLGSDLGVQGTPGFFLYASKDPARHEFLAGALPNLHDVFTTDMKELVG